MSYKTTKQDFEVFKKEAEKWIEFFQLSGWKFTFIHEDSSRAGKCLAWYGLNFCGRIASIGLSVNWNDEPDLKTEKNNILKKSAFHEVCETLLGSLGVLAKDRVWDEDVYEAENHTVIRILENSVFKRLK